MPETMVWRVSARSGQGNAGDAVGPLVRRRQRPREAEARREDAPPELFRRDQLAAAQAAPALEPGARVTERCERGGGDGGGYPEAQQGGIEGIGEDARAQAQQRSVAGDGAKGHGLDAAVLVAYLLGSVGAQAGIDERLGQGEHAEGVPLVGGRGPRRLPACRAGGREQGGGDGEAEHPLPSAQAPGGGAEAAPGIAARAGHGAPA